MGTDRRFDIWGRLVGVAAVFLVLWWAPVGANAAPPELLWQTPEDGLGGGETGRFHAPGGIATNAANGHLFVADRKNARVSELDAWGQPVRMWGWGVVASGPDNAPAKNERQRLTISATGGAYKLLYLNTVGGGKELRQETESISFDSSAAVVQAALEALPSLVPGDVTVSGPDGGPYLIEFAGEYLDFDLPPIGAVTLDENEDSTLIGGGELATTETLQDGGSFEICEPEKGDVCRAGQSGGAKPGQTPWPQAVAVDEDEDIYVSEMLTGEAGEEASFRVQKFGKSGNFELMWGGEVNKTTGANICTKASLEAGDECGSGVSGEGPGEFEVVNSSERGNRITVGPGGEIFVGDVERIQKFDVDGSFEGEAKVPGETIKTLAVNGQGEFYAVFLGKNGIRKLSADGAVLSVLAAGQPGALRVNALTIGEDDALFAAAVPVIEPSGQERIVKFDPAGVQLIGAGEHWAESPVLGGLATSDACGIAGEDIYVSQRGLGQDRLRAYGPLPNPALCPPPKLPPTISDQYAISAEPDSGTVQALINPHFWLDTRYYVQYGTSECSKGGCIDSQPLPPGRVLTNKVFNAPVKSSSVTLTSLSPNTKYYYRFVAQSSGGGPVVGLLGKLGEDGGEATFTTRGEEPSAGALDSCPNAKFRTGASSSLPDCRAYEMVSPIDKDNGDILTLYADIRTRSFAALNQSSADGEKLTYSSYRSFGDAQSAPIVSAYLASRTSNGWESRGISPARGRNLLEVSRTTDTQFKAFSSDLCSAWVLQESDIVLASGGLDGFPSLYRRDNCGPEANTYTTLMSVKPPNREPSDFLPELQGVSGDGSHVIFTAPDSLTGQSDTGILKPWLYEAFGAGEIRLVCILPNGTPVTEGCSAGTASSPVANGRREAVSNAISEDGSRIFWSDVPFKNQGRIYVRIKGKQTLAVSKEAEEQTGHQGSQYWAAAADGSRAIFTVGEIDSGEVGLINGQANLYEFDVDSKTTTLIAKGAMGLLGASEDAKRIYLVSKEALEGGALAGKPNLYLHEAGKDSLTFIATLSSADAQPALRAIFSPISYEPSKHTAQVTKDGQHAVFMSTASLTGFDNTDIVSGEPDAEVYRYAAETGQLLCVSCNPTGVRPAGRNIGGDLPPWAAAQIAAPQTQVYQAPHPMSEDGARIIFQSFESLVGSDTNSKQDVYQWEKAGNGSCEETSASYDPLAGGCVTLISTGKSAQDSEFIDTGEEGEDIFFTTTSSLVSQDPGLIDVYDARGGGGLPPPPVSPTSCEGESCQVPALPPAEVTPASSAPGAGNQHKRSKLKPRCLKKAKHRTRSRKGGCAHKNGKASGRSKGRSAG